MSNYRIHLDAPDTGYVLHMLVYGQWVRRGTYFDTYKDALASVDRFPSGY